MGMDLSQDVKIINQTTYKLLEEGESLINAWNLDIKHNWELDIYWKQFFFDIIEQLVERNEITFTKDWLHEGSFFEYFKCNYQEIIDDYDLSITIDDYEELVGYMPFSDWKELNDPTDGWIDRSVTPYKIDDDKTIYVLAQARYW